MFEPTCEVQAASSSGQERPSAAVVGAGEDKVEGDVVGPLGKALARLAPQREDMARAAHRDDNFVMKLEPMSKLETALDQAFTHCEDEGRKAKEKSKEEGAVYMGNPPGKRPDALAKAVIFRIAEPVGGQERAGDGGGRAGLGPGMGHGSAGGADQHGQEGTGPCGQVRGRALLQREDRAAEGRRGRA
ncbi:unnamed protein product [Prorocentrum cordatum]|uniref:Uncharacterized protein n=1 Tax=Prorocentrum cordatum TaxID=2364126 RepID=A0ABN9PGI6_9DINO|nr:unnamed protein product [Polarella glacialis]